MLYRWNLQHSPCWILQTFNNDLNTGFIRPVLWAILSSKEEECYYQAFKIIKDIVSCSGSLNWNLASASLDFEAGLINGFKKVFTDSRLIGCLFHFKQALYREAQIQGLTTAKLKEQSQVLISALGSLSWKGDLDSVVEALSEIEAKYNCTEHSKLVSYYKNSWLPRLQDGLIDYSSIEDEYRANSVLESYNCHVKDSLARSSTWPKFLEFLLSEEASYVNESFQAEQKGQILSKSVNFGKTFLPKQMQKKNSKEQNSLIKRPIDQSINGDGKKQSLKRKRDDNYKSLIEKNEAKRDITDFQNEKVSNKLSESIYIKTKAKKGK